MDNFKELLLRKTDNPYLQTLIKCMRDDLLEKEVFEALIKMAEPPAAMGRGANSALTSYAGHMDNSDVEQLRDALGHHISHYKGALKSMHAATDPMQKAKLRGVADQHLNRIVPLMHIAGRAGKHSGGKMTLDYISTTPWESNYTTTHRHEHNGKLKEGTKDLGRRPAPNANREQNIRAVPDYLYLEMAPHSGHPMSETMPHKGGYPFEEVQLGSPSKRDTGQAYLPIEDIENKTEYTPHPFDFHPIHELGDHPEHKLTPEQKEKFINDISNWKSSEHHKKWLEDQKAKFKANPEAYRARGTKKPGHVFEGIPLQDQPEHVKVSATSDQPAPTTTAAPAAVKQQAASTPAAPAEDFDITKPPSDAAKPIVESWHALPEAVRREIHKYARKK